MRTEQQPCLVKIKAKATRFTNAQTYHGSRVQQRIHKINLDNTSYLSILLPHGHVESVDDVHLLAHWRWRWRWRWGHGIQLAHVETTTEFDQLAPLLGRGPNAVQLIAVHAELCARVQGVEHCVLGQDIGPGSPEEGGKLLLLVGRGRQVLGLGQRGLVGDGVVVVVNELLQTSTRDEYGTNKSCETSLRQCHEESYYLPAPRVQR